MNLLAERLRSTVLEADDRSLLFKGLTERCRFLSHQPLSERERRRIGAALREASKQGLMAGVLYASVALLVHPKRRAVARAFKYAPCAIHSALALACYDYVRTRSFLSNEDVRRISAKAS
ncbi:hypothetical protein AAVH_23604 [Aphelenchoides avenae]|nr:hypothetical protein AAVH_23604 [Aphelenchus avenae]